MLVKFILLFLKTLNSYFLIDAKIIPIGKNQKKGKFIKRRDVEIT